MKKYSLCVVLSFIAVLVFGQEISNANYLKVDDKIWKDYYHKIEELSNFQKKYPEKRDSIRKLKNLLYNKADHKNLETAIKFAATSKGFERLFAFRLALKEDTLRNIFNALPDSIKSSQYGKSMHLHLNTDQIEEGKQYFDFEATDDKGREILFSSLAKGKNILLLYGGMYCMQEEGRAFIQKLCEDFCGKKMDIIIFDSKAKNLEVPRKEKAAYKVDFTFISDFKRNHSPMKIIYGTQATPTCFLINQEGKVILKTEGLDYKRLMEYKKINK